jgi:spermidine synthase
VGDRAAAMQAVHGAAPPELPAGAPAGLRRRSEAIEHWVDGELDEALSSWRAQPDEPGDSVAIATLAEALAEAGDPTARRYIALLRPDHAVEADAFEARMLFNQSRLAQAGDTLDRSFERAATDPWPLTLVLDRALDLALELAGRDRTVGQQMMKRLAHPFAVLLLEDKRRRTLVSLAHTLDWPGLCQQALAPLEPNLPWEEELLGRRVTCYEATRDPRLPLARADLARYRAHEPMPFADGLPPPDKTH